MKKDKIMELLASYEATNSYPDDNKIQEYNWWINAIQYITELVGK